MSQPSPIFPSIPPQLRGVSDQRLQTLGRGAVAGQGRRRCDAVFPPRRSKPLASRRTFPCVTGAKMRAPKGLKPRPAGESSIPGFSKAAREREPGGAPIRAPQRWIERSSPPGAERSKPINTARGTPGIRQSRGDYVCALSTNTVHRAAGSFGPRRSARPRFLKGDGMKSWKTVCPGPTKQCGR